MSRVRSPGYPALSLSSAVDLIRKVHSVQQATPEPRDVVIKHMGYSGVSGRSLKAISALIKYGFLEKKGKELYHSCQINVLPLRPSAPSRPREKDRSLLFLPFWLRRRLLEAPRHDTSRRNP